MYLVQCSNINLSKIDVKCLLRPHLKSFQRVSNDSSVAMLAVAAGAVRSRSTRVLPTTSALAFKHFT